MYIHKILEYLKAFKLFAFLLFSRHFGYADLVICKDEKVFFYSKSYKYDWPNKVCVYELVYPLCSFLEYAIVIFHYFYSFVAIVYAFIFNVVNVMVY